ncbi:SdpI family protein [Flammeovirgaceae bacterium SG7u.111]|nr:SdpI family protein [Flammeovirgaceae bacterium SG7u.132]WPO35552.1 SdpI family protein [Flammeovirgaceae bacterium SG7u.111]
MDVKSYLKKEWLFFVVLLIPFVVYAIMWESIPEKLPSHWNYKGEIDGYTQKGLRIFFLPFINVIVYVLVLFVPKIDPKKRIDIYVPGVRSLRFVLCTFLSALSLLILATGLGYVSDSSKIINQLIILLLVFLGNYMGKIKPNYFIGVRTPWTLENKEVWKKTHRFTGLLWVLASVPMLFISIFLSSVLMSKVFTAFVLTIALIPVVYSYILFKKLQHVENTSH